MPEIRSVKIDDLETHPEQRVNVKDLAQYWGVNESTVYRLAQHDAIRSFRIGRRVKIDRGSALAFERDAGKPSDEKDDGQAR
jgi:excisionase family DNA binding protein